MANQLEIMSQVLLSFKVDQSNIMNNINALLNNRNNEINLIDKIKNEIKILSNIHESMRECETFMLQLAATSIKDGNSENDNLNQTGE